MTPAGRRLRTALAVLALLDVGTTAYVFHLVGPTVEGNPLAAALVPLVGASGMLVVMLAVKLALGAGAGAVYSRLAGRRAVMFATAAVAPLFLVVCNNTAALVILGRM